MNFRNRKLLEILNRIFPLVLLIIILSVIYVLYIKINMRDLENILLKEEFNLKVGETQKIVKDNNKNLNYIYESTNYNIVDIDNQGMVTAISKGTAKIKVKDLNEKYIAECVINVTEIKPTEIKVIGITLNETKLEMKVNDSKTITATVSPSNATNKNVIWTSSNTNVVKIENGKITAISAGTAIITAKTEDGGYTATTTVIVKETEIKVIGITLNETKLEMKVNDSKTITATVSPSNATNKNVIWTSSNTNVVKIENGKITAISAGTAIITAKTEDGGYTAKTTITVKSSIKIHFIRQNDSADVILLESNGHFAMIDAGLDDNVNKEITKDYLNELNVKKLDFLLITHNHKDHIAFAPRLIKYYFEKIDTIYIKTYLGNDNYSSSGKTRYNNLISYATEKNIPIKYIEKLGEGYTIKFDKMTIQLYNTIQQMVEGKYYGKNENYNSVYQLVTINGTKTFLASDGFSKHTLDPTVNIIGNIDLLKMPHHGYNSCGVTDNSASKMDPENIIITNSYERLNGQYDCINRFPNIPMYYVNNDDIKKSVIVDYSDGNIKIIKN